MLSKWIRGRPQQPHATLRDMRWTISLTHRSSAGDTRRGKKRKRGNEISETVLESYDALLTSMPTKTSYRDQLYFDRAYAFAPILETHRYRSWSKQPRASRKPAYSMLCGRWAHHSPINSKSTSANYAYLASDDDKWNRTYRKVRNRKSDKERIKWRMRKVGL